MKGKILVTGGTGYIGSHSTVELQNAGYEVVIIDNLSNSNIEVLDGIERITGKRPTFVQADCTDMEALRQLFKENPGIKGIIHFAASKAVGESVQKPLLYYRNNLMSLVNLLTLMPEYGVEGIVFSSSCTVYGQPDVLPVDESAPIKPALSPYGNTKQICEEIIKDTIHASAPFKSIILRYFNPIGAHPTAEIGELPNGVPQNLIPYLVVKDMRNRVNRQVNCETANLQKTVDAAVRQTHLVQKLLAKESRYSLSPKIREACDLRLAHPNASLSELAEICGITKSGLAHRFKKIEAMVGGVTGD